MKTPILLFAVSLSLFIFSCAKKEDKQVLIKECPPFLLEDGEITDIIEYKIIDAVVENDFSNRGEVQIISTTQTNHGGGSQFVIEYLSTESIELPLENIEEYLSKNTTLSIWNSLFESSAIVSIEEKDCLFGSNPFPCESYSDKYPEGVGYISFMRPTYFDDNTAIVEYDMNFCSGGRGNLVFLKLEDNKWSVVASITTNIS